MIAALIVLGVVALVLLCRRRPTNAQYLAALGIVKSHRQHYREDV
jgi:hypothetical protein